MNILISTDKSYLTGAKITLYSLSLFNKNLDVYVFNCSLNSKEIKDLESFIKNKCNAEPHIINVNAKRVNEVIYEQFINIKPEQYIRIFAPYLLHKQLDRILWLDGDCIVRDSLDEFYNQPFDGAYAVMIRDQNIYYHKQAMERIKSLGLTAEEYYNSGVMLFNLSLWRENIPLSTGELETLLQESEFSFPDQDFINLLLKDKIKAGDGRYNSQYFLHSRLTQVNEAKIIHTVGNKKLWLENLKDERNFEAYEIAEIFWDYARKADIDNSYYLSYLYCVYRNAPGVNKLTPDIVKFLMNKKKGEN